jgi:hypothetical protein
MAAPVVPVVPMVSAAITALLGRLATRLQGAAAAVVAVAGRLKCGGRVHRPPTLLSSRLAEVVAEEVVVAHGLVAETAAKADSVVGCLCTATRMATVE